MYPWRRLHIIREGYCDGVLMQVRAAFLKKLLPTIRHFQVLWLHILFDRVGGYKACARRPSTSVKRIPGVMLVVFLHFFHVRIRERYLCYLA